MGSVFKPFVTRPMPEGAEVVTKAGKAVAVWIDAGGKRRQAPITGERAKRPGIRERAATYSAQFRDGDGVVRRVPTGCKTAEGARAVLADLERRAEQVRSGVVTQAESSVAAHAGTPIAEHVDAYIEALARKRGKGARRAVSPRHVANVRHALRLVVAECGFRRLRDMHREAVERWVQRTLGQPDADVLDDAGNVTAPGRPAARTVNTRLVALTAWGNWLVESGRLVVNPFTRLRKVDEADDVRRQRRGLTGGELGRLLTVARLRPIAEYGRGTIRVVDDTRPKSSRQTWRRADLTTDTIVEAAERGRARLRPDVAARLEHEGRGRAMLYAVLVTTGLRKGELTALTDDDVRLDGRHPVIVLAGADAKNGQRATLPLRADVADELRAWMATKSEATSLGRAGVGAATTPPGRRPLLYVPTGLVRILDRDLRAAGIPKRDDRGRTVDVHALRHTFATHLVAAGVAPRTAQAALRHSSLELTMQHYTDPRLLDVVGALDSLPALPSAGMSTEPVRAVGAGPAVAVALGVALDAGNARQNVSSRGRESGRRPAGDKNGKRTKSPKNCVIPAQTEERAKGLEPSTSSLGS
jgi:integrase